MSPADRTDSRIKTSGPANPAPNQAPVQPAERTIDLRGGPDDPKLKAPNHPNVVVVTRRPAPSGRVAKVADRMRSGATDFRRYDPVLLVVHWHCRCSARYWCGPPLEGGCWRQTTTPTTS